MKDVNVSLTDEEVASIEKYLPMLDKMKHLIPNSLLSVFHKVKESLNG
jgi:hypothetical protein